jgi:hypothetical protein
MKYWTHIRILLKSKFGQEAMNLDLTISRNHWKQFFKNNGLLRLPEINAVPRGPLIDSNLVET